MSRARGRLDQTPTNDPQLIVRDLVSYARHSPRRLGKFRSLVSAQQFVVGYRAVLAHVPAGSSVLDWGAGGGHFSYGLQRIGHKVTGYAFRDFPLREHLGGDYLFKVGSGSDPVGIPFEDSSIDAVASIGVLEHVRETGGDEVKSLSEVRRILRPGGVFICCHLPNRRSWIEALRTAVMRHSHHHENTYTDEDVRQMCDAAGLELVEHRRYAFLPRNFWNSMPAILRNSSIVATIWGGLDRLLHIPLGAFSQNHLFVARRPLSGV